MFRASFVSGTLLSTISPQPENSKTTDSRPHNSSFHMQTIFPTYKTRNIEVSSFLRDKTNNNSSVSVHPL